MSEGSQNKLLKLSVLDETNSKPELIGDTVIQLEKAYHSSIHEGYDDWHELTYRGKYAGEVYLEMTFYPSASTVRKFKKLGLTRGLSDSSNSSSMSRSCRSISDDSKFGDPFSKSYYDASDSLRYSLSASMLGLSTSRPLPSEPNCNKNAGVSKTTDNIDSKSSCSVQKLHNPNVPPALSPAGVSLSHQNSLHSQSQPNLLVTDQPAVPMHTSLRETPSPFNMSALNHSLPNIPSATNSNESADFARGLLDLPTIPPEAPQHRISSSGTVINRPRAIAANSNNNTLNEDVDEEAENFFRTPIPDSANEHASQTLPDQFGQSQQSVASSMATVIHNVYSNQSHAYLPTKPSPLSQSTRSNTSVETLQYQTHSSSQPPVTPPVHSTPRSSLGTIGTVEDNYEFGSTVVYNKPRHSLDNASPAMPFSQLQGDLPSPPSQQPATNSEYYNSITENAASDVANNGRNKRSIKRKPIKTNGSISSQKQNLANQILPYPDATYSVSGQISDSDEDLKEIPFSPDSYMSSKVPNANGVLDVSPTKQKVSYNNGNLSKPLTAGNNNLMLSARPDLSVTADGNYMIKGQWDISNELNSGYSDEIYDEVTNGYKHHNYSRSDASSSGNSSFPVTPAGSPIKTQPLSSFPSIPPHRESLRGDARRPKSSFTGYNDDYYDDDQYNDDLIMEGIQGKSNNQMALNLAKIPIGY